MGGSPRGTSPRRWPAPAGRISSAAVRRDRLQVGLERPGVKVARSSGRELYSTPRPDLAASRGRGLSARCAFSPPRGEGRGPLLPARLSTGADCPQCAPTASRRQGGDRLTTKGVRGLRRCRQPTRPVLKHGPRSLTHARVRGSSKTPWRNESEGQRALAEVGSRPRGGGRTTGPSRPHRRGGGA